MPGCINHPDGTRDPRGWFQPLRRAYVEMCDGNACAALLLANFEHWTNLRAERGQDGWVYRSRDELRSDLFRAYGHAAIDKALCLLVDRGFIERRNNPKVGFDRKFQYQLGTEAIQAAIDSAGQTRIPDDGSLAFLDCILEEQRSNTEEPREEPKEEEGLREEERGEAYSTPPEDWESPFSDQGLPQLPGAV